ncbi:MAG: MurR/RpiR family transcriptional regulator [Lachnospiraceae bacterium]|jgi:DNA-binding MurR/RpiR family transcriptional regulator|nr:MurR/RpiR family transcriptional regulator [Lachnospiraceae bacterium]
MKTRELIEEKYLTLTKTEKSIANFILQDQTYSIINMTLLELSKRLQLGEASIIRFCRKMGFRGFQDLKLSMAIENAQEEDTKEAGEIDNNEIMENMVRVIQNTNTGIDREGIQQAIELMDDSENVLFYGVGSSGFTAEIAETRLLRVGKRCKAIKESHLQTIQSAIMGAQDVVIGISISGTTNDLYQALKIAKNNGSKMIAITNHKNSPIAELADCVLLTNAPENPVTGGTFTSVVAQLYVLDLLFTYYTAKNWQKAYSYREKVAISINEKLDEK